MESIGKWALAVCATALICTLLRYLFPNNGVGKQGQMLLPCLFLWVLLSPLLTGFQDVKLPDFTHKNEVDSAPLTQQMRQQLTAQVEQRLLEMVNGALATYGWQAKKVTADMDIGEDGSINMGQITLYVDEDTIRRATAVRQVAEKRLGASVRIMEWEGSE